MEEEIKTTEDSPIEEFNLTLFEVCEMLSKSRRSVSRYVGKNLLHPQLVRSKQGTLEYRFSQNDIRDFKIKQTEETQETGQVGHQTSHRTSETGQQTDQTRQETSETGQTEYLEDTITISKKQYYKLLIKEEENLELKRENKNMFYEMGSKDEKIKQLLSLSSGKKETSDENVIYTENFTDDSKEEGKEEAEGEVIKDIPEEEIIS